MSVSSESPGGDTKEPALSWQKHTGLILAGATSLLICVKILAVAGWDSTTAFGILSTSGTTNVLTGSLLAVFPVLYAYLFVFAIPRIERELKRRTSVERSAARVLETWPSILLVLIVPAYLQVAVVAMFVALIIVHIWQNRTKTTKGAPENNKHSATRKRPSRFELTSVALAGVMLVSYSSLATPWLPAEVVSVGDKERTAYALDKSSDVAVVLLANNRKLQQINVNSLTGKYCQQGPRWLTEPAVALLAQPRYPSCPN